MSSYFRLWEFTFFLQLSARARRPRACGARGGRNESLQRCVDGDYAIGVYNDRSGGQLRSYQRAVARKWLVRRYAVDALFRVNGVGELAVGLVLFSVNLLNH